MALGAVAGDAIAAALLRRIDAAERGRRPSPSCSGPCWAAAFLGQAVGLVVGQRLRHVLPFGGVRQADRVAGAGAGVIGIVLALWLLLPIMAEKSGWFAIQSRTSALAEIVDDRLPGSASASRRVSSSSIATETPRSSSRRLLARASASASADSRSTVKPLHHSGRPTARTYTRR